MPQLGKTCLKGQSRSRNQCLPLASLWVASTPPSSLLGRELSARGDRTPPLQTTRDLSRGRRGQEGSESQISQGTLAARAGTPAYQSVHSPALGDREALGDEHAKHMGATPGSIPPPSACASAGSRRKLSLAPPPPSQLFKPGRRRVHYLLARAASGWGICQAHRGARGPGLLGAP